MQFANTLLQDQMVFGSDYPFITPERWLADFEDAGFRPAVHEKILLLNARRALGLDRMSEATPPKKAFGRRGSRPVPRPDRPAASTS